MRLTPVPCYIMLIILIIKGLIVPVDGPEPPLLNCPEPSKKVVAGHQVLLQCSTNHPEDLVKLEWLFNDKVDVYLFRKGKTDNNQSKMYKGKTSISEDEIRKGDYSLLLTAEMSHSGKYRCRVFDGSNTTECCINVTVLPAGEDDSSQKHQDDHVSPDKPNNRQTQKNWTIDSIVGLAVVVAVGVAVGVVGVAALIDLGISRYHKHGNPQNEPVDPNPNEEQLPLEVVEHQGN